MTTRASLSMSCRTYRASPRRPPATPKPTPQWSNWKDVSRQQWPLADRVARRLARRAAASTASAAALLRAQLACEAVHPLELRRAVLRKVEPIQTDRLNLAARRRMRNPEAVKLMLAARGKTD